MLFRLSACLNLCTHWLARSGDSEEMLQLLRMFRSALRQDVAPAEDELPVERGEAETGWLTEMERQTRQQNRNNLTRTAAYLDVYRRNPELHWAFLAHMVSRNGGWNMTDLRGEWFQRLTDDRLVDAFFRFLEQANWLIFSDAYPQLLMYEWSKREGRDLSGYLGRFGVSRFMRVVWRWFWQHRNASVLTRALIVNEQNFLESRIMRNAHYRATVLRTAAYRIQSALDLTHIVFPFLQNGRVQLAGEVAHRFASLEDRIVTGQRLYQLLFSDHHRHRAFVRWANAVVHTGSRQDYGTHWFTTDQAVLRLDQPYRPWWSENGMPRKLYSPRLVDAWPDVAHPAIRRVDWFRSLWQVLPLFGRIRPPLSPEAFTRAYVAGLRRVDQLVQWEGKADALLTNQYTER